MKNMALVFQYGSNTSSLRLNSQERLRGEATSLGLAYTVGQFKLGFTVWSKRNNCATADLVRARGKKVWGVLYEIPDNLLSKDTATGRRSLDEIEGPRYRRRKIRVYRAGAPLLPSTVWTYTVIAKKKGLKTSRDYVKHILAGLQEHHAPPEYIAHVKTLVFKNNPDLRTEI
jgi:hypothetical protein